MGYDVVKSARLLAMHAVTRDPLDADYFFRKIFRWYSRTFATPLHMVEELPLEDVLEAYFESVYEELEGNRLDDEIRALLETEEERKVRLSRKSEDDADDLAYLERVKKEAQQQEALQTENPVINPVVPIQSENPIRNETPLAQIHEFVNANNLPENISISFVDPEEIQVDADPFDLSSPSKGPPR